ncbi:MAG TPA: efflux RND transporter permease subunit [Pseudomonadales bacterium]|nr:efflux RND transporter permease subunit [Pseudomonadales bacterium]
MSELCVKRPVFATVLSLVIMLIGLVSLDRLVLREYPHVDKPTINIRTFYVGASAEIVESEVTTPIEELMAGLEGVDYMSSTSRPGVSQIDITFRSEQNIEDAASGVRDRIARVQARLPRDILPPTIWKQEADSSPTMYVVLSSARFSMEELTEIANDRVKDRLQVIEGVSEIIMFGGRELAMRVWINRDALAAYGLTVQDVEGAIRRQNVEIPSGFVESAATELTILTNTGLRTPEEFADIVVAKRGNVQIRLGDVARVELGSAATRTEIRVDGVSALGMGVRVQSVANPLEVSNLVREALATIRPTLPDSIDMQITMDNAETIRDSIDNVFVTFVEAVVLVVLVIFLFLRRVRATLIPLVTIPISLIGVNALMWWWGFSLNTLTLLAMVLAIGIVVDDAIVVLENVYRHIEMGKPARQAAIDGSKEIFFAVVAMTLTLAAVFAPLAFAEGDTGKLFIEFALTLAGAVLISGFIAVTLTPMMCSMMLASSDHAPAEGAWQRFSSGLDNHIEWWSQGYGRVAAWFVGHPWIAMLALLISALGAVYLLQALPQELAPKEDKNRVIVMAIGPEGTNIGYAEKYMGALINRVRDIPEMRLTFAMYGNPTINNHRFTALLKDADERERSQFEVHSDIKKMIAEQPGMIFISMDMPSLSQSRNSRPIHLVLQSSAPIEELAAKADQVVEALNKSGVVTGVNLDLRLNKPQLEIDYDRAKLADAGISVETVSRTLETLFGGRTVTEFQRGPRQYDVIVQTENDDRVDPRDIDEVYLRTEDGSLVALQDVVYQRETIVPREISHFNKLRAAQITALPADGYGLGDALAVAIDEINALNIPDLTLDYIGQSREFLKAGSDIYMTMLLAVVFIYLVLAAQFESFTDPIIIMLSVPFAIFGAALLLTMTGKSLSIFSQIGIITLVGLITKHGIMLVDTANRLRDDGMAKLAAILEASRQRFRPIIMTTAAMVLGSLPLALASGAGSESRSQIGWVVVGGLAIGTVFTLLVTPVLYSLLSRKDRRVGDLHV